MHVVSKPVQAHPTTSPAMMGGVPTFTETAAPIRSPQDMQHRHVRGSNEVAPSEHGSSTTISKKDCAGRLIPRTTTPAPAYKNNSNTKETTVLARSTVIKTVQQTSTVAVSSINKSSKVTETVSKVKANDRTCKTYQEPKTAFPKSAANEKSYEEQTATYQKTKPSQVVTEEETPIVGKTVPKRTKSSSSTANDRFLPLVNRRSFKGTIESDVNNDERSLASRDPPGSHAGIPMATITVTATDGQDDIATGTSIGSTQDDDSNKDGGAQFFHNEQYGLDGIPTEEHKLPAEDVERRYAQALCFAIGSEGVYTKDQVAWIMGLLSSKGYSHTIVDAIPTMLKESSQLMELELVVESKKLITEDLHKESALLVYDMYRAAAEADFPNEQMCAIAMIAEEIGVDKFGHLEGIRKQVVAEIELKKQRIKLLYPEGHDLLDEKYEELVEDNSNNNNNRTSSKAIANESRRSESSCRNSRRSKALDP